MSLDRIRTRGDPINCTVQGNHVRNRNGVCASTIGNLKSIDNRESIAGLPDCRFLPIANSRLSIADAPDAYRCLETVTLNSPRLSPK